MQVVIISNLTTTQCKTVNGKRDLTQGEKDWILPLQAQMIEDSEQRGLHSDNPCRLLFHPERLKVGKKRRFVFGVP